MSINKEKLKNLVLPEIPKEEKIMSSTQKSKKGQRRNAQDKNWIHPFER
jgi:hypothetical protein